MRRRYRWQLGGLVLAALLAFGHWWYHYAPRARPAVPSGPEASLLELPWAETSVWVPYPHQNLAALEKRSGLPAEAAHDVLVLAGVEPPSLPAFGGMLSPPARSMTLATGVEGQLAVAVRVYPLFAAFARLAGRLAENPWLRGGDVVWNERSVRVEWRGTLWLAGMPSLPVLAEPAEPMEEPSLLVASARRPTSPLPAGRYRFHLSEGDSILSSYQPARSADAWLDGEASRRAPVHAGDGAEARSGASIAPKTRQDALLLVIAGPQPGLLDSPSAQAMTFFGQDPDDLSELPRASIISGGVGERWSLPAEGLLELAGREIPSARSGGWSLVATDSEALRVTLGMAPELAARLNDATEGELALDLWLDLAPAAVEMKRLRLGLERAPFVRRERLRRWRSAERLLHGLSLEHSALRLRVTPEHGLVLRAERRRPETGS
ncbi:MAG: hypothetical protein AAF725_18020 [Acidobacteriota bacterium]